MGNLPPSPARKTLMLKLLKQQSYNIKTKRDNKITVDYIEVERAAMKFQKGNNEVQEF